MSAVNEETNINKKKTQNPSFNTVNVADKESKPFVKLSNVVTDSHHTLDLPENYKGSNMFMPTGEQLYWQAEVIPQPNSPATYQDFEEIRSHCLSEGVLFEDPEFPAENSSLPKDERNGIKWLRPKDLVNKPKLCVKSYCKFDVRQGQLGDCWLDAAIATLTTHSNFFDQVVPSDQSFDNDYAGIFHFRFWQYGHWVDVVIDDRLPTRNGRLVFLRSFTRNEFWSPLLEKAYAKLHGSYGAIEGGFAADALEDFTGGLAKIYEISDLPENFIEHIHKAYVRQSLMCASINKRRELRDDWGLIGGHAYSITGVKFLDSDRLIRLRNPWGSVEWKGAWSDKSENWKEIPEKKKRALDLTVKNDGEFWISFEDFTEFFYSVTICSLSPDFLYPNEDSDDCAKKWKMSMFEGKWVKDGTAGGGPTYPETYWRNPQYIITVTDPDEGDDEDTCTVIISLMQKYSRTRYSKRRLAIGFNVYRVEDEEADHFDEKFFEENEPVNDPMEYTDYRGVSAQYKLEPGRFVIVLSTSEPNQEREFLLRVLTEKTHEMFKPRHR